MKAIELFTADGGEPRAAMCSHCKRIYPIDIKHLAESCCVCSVCGEVESPRETHWKCFAAHHAKKQLDDLASAEVVPYDGGWIFSPEVSGYQEGFFGDIAELVDHCRNSGERLPERVHMCDEVAYSGIDIAGAIEQMADEHGEGWTDGLDGFDELSAAAVAFDEINKKHVSYTSDPKRVCIVADALAASDGKAAQS